MYFYKCNHCGKVLFALEDKGIPTICCGEEMKLLTPNTTDAAFEKHVPVVKEHDNLVQVSVGEVIHPMTNEHYIEFIVLHTDQGYKVKHLHPSDLPVAEFALKENEIIFSAYAYCNLHGLWKKSVE